MDHCVLYDTHRCHPEDQATVILAAGLPLPGSVDTASHLTHLDLIFLVRPS